MSEPVTGFGRRPIGTSPRAPGPAFETRQGRKAREVGHPAQRALWGFRLRRRCSERLVKLPALRQAGLFEPITGRTSIETGRIVD